MRKVVIGVFLLASSVSVLGFPGYVSRDCIVVGTKEAITVDWKKSDQFFYTEVFYKIVENQQTVIKYRQSYPCGGPRPCYVKGWRSYAGDTNLRNTLVQMGVNGSHYWWRNNNEDSTRYSYAKSCNLESWGYDNWG